VYQYSTETTPSPPAGDLANRQGLEIKFTLRSMSNPEPVPITSENTLRNRYIRRIEVSQPLQGDSNRESEGWCVPSNLLLGSY
jgi:hypothetical protein